MKKILLLLLTALCILMLFSCNSEKGEKGEDETQKVPERINIENYTICYAEGSGEKTQAAVASLASSLSRVYGVQIAIESDFVLPGDQIPTGENEIIIGKTNRLQSSALISETDTAFDWHILYDGKSICAVGGSDEATAKAVLFLEALIEDDGLFLDENYSKDYIHTYPCKNAVIFGVGLKEYTIVYHASPTSKALAKELCAVINEKTGVELPVASSDNAPIGNRILVGTEEELREDKIDDVDGYGIFDSYGDLAVAFNSGNSAYSVLKTIEELFSSDVNIESGYSDTRKTDVFRVSILGDSNTAMAYFQLWTDLYLTTRYPDTIIELDNRGISGDSIEGGLNRLDWDIYPSNPDAVIVCYGGNGMTEYVGTLTDTPVSQIICNSRKNWYLGAMKSIIEKLQSKGIEVIISSPVCYDEWADSTTAPYKFVHVTYIELTQKMKEMAQQYNADFVDMYNNMLPITRDYRENTGDCSIALMNKDRKHANMTGALAGAFAYVEDSRWASELVASVEIDAVAKTANADNANISLEISSPKYVSYTYKPKAIPLTVDDNYTKLLTYGTLDLNARNREIIKVTGLEDGDYLIRFDGKVVTSASAQKLSEGIDISALSTNPSQKTSAEIFELLRKKETNVASVRTFYYAEKNFIRKNNLTHLTAEERVALFQEQLDKNLVSGYMVDVMESYINKQDEMKSYDENNAYYEFMARLKANTDAYSVEIIKK